MSTFNLVRKSALIAAVPAFAIGLAACGNSGDTQTDKTVTVDGEEVNLGVVIETRQENFKTFGKSAKSISDAIKTGDPTSDDVISAINTLEDLSNELETWFPEGSGPDSGVKTAAKADIWENPEAFAAAADEFQLAADALREAGESGDAGAIKLAFGSVGKTCGNCHDDFKMDDD